jgi:hypothetical protein
MPEQQISNQELLDILLPELRSVSQMSQANSVTLATVVQQLAQLAATNARLEKAVYGNGTPGIKAKVDDLEKRLSGVEGTCKLEQEADIPDRIRVIEDLHKEQADAKKAELAEWRKVKWGLVGTTGTVLVDILMHLVKF